jgi:mono/diheme cytochrome c family protein
MAQAVPVEIDRYWQRRFPIKIRHREANMTVRAGSIAVVFLGALFCTQRLVSQRPETTPLIPSVEGSDLYRAYCATCHGADARGGGPMAVELKSPLPDLTLIARHHKGRFPIEHVERIISGEEGFTTAHGSREMPMWGPIFSQIEWDQDLGRVRVHNLAKYIESIQAR